MSDTEIKEELKENNTEEMNEDVDTAEILSKETESDEDAVDKKILKEQKKAEKKAKKEAKKAVKAKSNSEKSEVSETTETSETTESSEEKNLPKDKDKNDKYEEEFTYDEEGNAIIKKKKKSKKKDKAVEDVNIVKELLSLIIYIGVVVLLCFFIINYVGCRSLVDGSSMNPTLENGDNLWVDKVSYTFGDPKRFDVIIFNYDDETTYVKRIIGLPGESVRIDSLGNIYINGDLLKENYGKETILPTNLGRASSEVYLGEDEYFVLGDNRNNSSDSRWADVGNVNREDIVGKVAFRFYPLKKFGMIK